MQLESEKVGFELRPSNNRVYNNTSEVSTVYILRELNGSHLEKSLILAKCSFCITHFKKTILEPNIAAHAWNQSTWEAKARDY